jgi:hypothetical protein
MSIQKMIESVSQMTNPELVGLAKNRYIPEELQMAIAETGYKIAIDHLAANYGLKDTVRDYLWSDACNRGYTTKTLLIQAEQYTEEPDKYWELYEKYPKMWDKSRWRALACFVGSYSWFGQGHKYTPIELLHKVYDEQINPKMVQKVRGTHYQYATQTMLIKLLNHPKCDLPLAIRISTSGIEKAEREAFKKIVELS